MNYLVDPDVLSASLSDRACEGALAQLMSDGAMHQFYCDAEQFVVREYRELFNQISVSNPEHPAAGLLQRILTHDDDDELKISGHYDEYADLLADIGCDAPVEPRLIGMLARARGLGLVLLLYGRNSGKTRKRVLHDEDRFRRVGKSFPWLEAAFAGMARVEMPAMHYRDEPTHPKSKEFELKVALWLQSIDSCLKCYPPPGKKQVGGEQIDVYGYRQTESGTQIVIAECKLWRAGNESKPIPRGALQQLRRKAIAARAFEQARRDRPFGDLSPNVKALLVSNALALDESACRLAAQERDLTLSFVTTQLSRGWEREDEWSIKKATWQNCFEE